ncbi:TPA: hypothetical protein ACXOGI_003892 [Pseudomonas aeruginosa]|uniref:hypothetical protein n=1 Tax=Pseudomonas TaxID=286 RepID=UPI0003B9EDA4|nr:MULTISPECIES: hypothetical protein [Pseudomonas]HCL2794207.1 hypothetical protein [Pseudomonas aeruginosa 7D9A]EIU7148983.1 hypothetical protein [Pseudomonas aeruginosa]ELQ7312832.1 hypothetical protein [Pseudomonas aeruginosa]ELQ7320037.1 hypothetical protein [Pseudomonas aeruginosa]ELQ7332034.1 hypothetical protein [Pseudomonas aeruginosa]
MPKLPSRTNVNVAAVVEAKLTPQLLIPCESPYRDESRHHFPCYDAILARRSAEHVRIVDEFADAIRTAQTRVWIIDKHIFSEDGDKPDHSLRIQKVANWFITEQLKSVRILTSRHDSRNSIETIFAELQEVVTSTRGKLGTPIDINLLFSLGDFDHIHDRFAIIDDELWHFGATVGGFHRDVNAASRGWDANTHRALDFFNLAWERSSTKSRRSA